MALCSCESCDNWVLMAAQCNFLLCEMWSEVCLGKTSNAVIEHNTERAEDREPFQPALLLAGQLVLLIKAKMSEQLPLSKSPRQLLTWSASAISFAPLVPMSLNIRLRYRREEFSLGTNKAESDESFFRHLVNFIATPQLHEHRHPVATHHFHLHPSPYHDIEAASKFPTCRSTKMLTEMVKDLKQRPWHTWHYP